MELIIPKNWKPTVDNINRLPDPLREYIYQLETDCDPAGTIRDNIFLKDCCIALQKMLMELKQK